MHELAPSAFPYFLLMTLPLAWHRPPPVAQLPIGAMVMMLVALVAAMEGVMGEAYSVWCFMGVALNLYYLAYPFLFGTPQRGKGSGAAGRRRAVKIKTYT